jgi:hypothetical protein
MSNLTPQEELQYARELMSEHKRQQRVSSEIRRDIQEFAINLGMEKNFAMNSVASTAFLLGYLSSRGVNIAGGE